MLLCSSTSARRLYTGNSLNALLSKSSGGRQRMLLHSATLSGAASSDSNNNNNNKSHIHAHETISLFDSVTNSRVSLDTVAPPTVNNADGQERLPSLLTMYVCGPTVYDATHLGHARTYIHFDVVRRLLAWESGREVVFAMNVTDLDDKIVARAAVADISCGELTNRFAHEFFEDMRALGVERPTVVPRVTGYVQRIIEFVKRLEQEGFAYARAGSVYFDTTAFEAQEGQEYGVMGGSNSSTADDDGDTVDVASESNTNSDTGRNTHVADKQSGRDFALWKHVEVKESEGRQQLGMMLGDSVWESPWGLGRPGWHVECSAMIEHTLGKVHDDGCVHLHGGGVDLKFPHHENERAQSEAHRCCGGNHTHTAHDAPSLHGILRDKNNDINDKSNSTNTSSTTAHTTSNLSRDKFQEEDNKQKAWAGAFMHTGHLHIEGLKMSKSLKNFITVRQVLGNAPIDTEGGVEAKGSGAFSEFRMTPRQMRLMFLLFRYSAPMELTPALVQNARGVDEKFANFFSSATYFMNTTPAPTVSSSSTSASHWSSDLPPELNDQDLDLLRLVAETRRSIHADICDDFNTPNIVRSLEGLVNAANAYIRLATNPTTTVTDMKSRDIATSTAIQPQVLNAAVRLIREVLAHVGIGQSPGFDACVQGYDIRVNAERTTQGEGGGGADIQALAELVVSFRHKVRTAALGENPKQSILALCDEMRNVDLIDVGILAQDRTGASDGDVGGSSWRALAPLEIEEHRQAYQDSKDKKKSTKIKSKAAHTAKLAKAAEQQQTKLAKDPLAMFTGKTELYSAFDERGVPTHSANGESLTQTAVKKLRKKQQRLIKEQQKLLQHNEKTGEVN